ncbi:MAG: PQQ-binding-like beta-propeller repeat protein [bacterium]
MHTNVKFLLIAFVILCITGLAIEHSFYSCSYAEGIRLYREREYPFIYPKDETSPIQESNGLLPAYAQSSWPSIHRDSRNSDYLPSLTAGQLKSKWHALSGEYSSVLTAVVIGPEGHIYFTTGKEESYGNLHAFDKQGNELWRSYLPDNGAFCSAPLLDRQGNIYLGDSDEFFCFYPDGNLKWKCSGVEGPFASACFSLDGHIIGIGVSGLVYVFDPQDGHVVVPPLELPGQSPDSAYKIPTPPGLWQGMVSNGDHLTISDIFNGLMGRQYKITNTPAVNPVNGRVYISGTVRSYALSDVQGRFFGVDFIPATVDTPAKLQLAFQTEMEPGSGSSPAISPNGSHIYTLDDKGTLYAFDTEGENVWTLDVQAQPASPAIGQDGTIYGVSKSQVYAVKDLGDSGQILWRLDFNDTIIGNLLNSFLPVPSRDENPSQRVKPSMQCNSVVSVSKNHLYLTMALGYEVSLQEETFSHLYPLRNLLVVLTPFDSQKRFLPTINSFAELPDTSESVLTLDKDGTVYCAHGSVSSSVAYSISQRMGINIQKPEGGVSVLEPAHPREMVRSQMKWIKDLITMALQSLRRGNVDSAKASLDELMEDIQFMKESSDTGQDSGADNDQAVQRSVEEITRIYNQIESAQAILKDMPDSTRKMQSAISKAKMCLRTASSTCRRTQLMLSSDRINR